MFCGYDGISKTNLEDIEIERRAGYRWYCNWPSALFTTEYNSWISKNGL